MILVACAFATILTLEDTPTVPLQGQVLDFDGKPVAGALVAFSSSMSGQVDPTVQTTTSDPAGRFRLNRPVDSDKDHKYYSWTLWAASRGHAIVDRHSAGNPPPPSELILLTLGKPVLTNVLVVDPEGLSIAGASVRVDQVVAYFPPEPILAYSESTTDAEGRSELPGFAATEVIRVRVDADGYGTQFHDFPPTAGVKRFELLPVGRLVVRLVSDDLKAAENWRVRAYTRPKPFPEYHGFATGIGESITGEDCRAVFPSIAAGVVSFDLEPPSDSNYGAEIPRGLKVVTGRENLVEVPLKRLATVTGQVVERETGRPIPGVKFAIGHMNELSMWIDPTDRNGRFTTRSRPGDVHISLGNVPPSYVKTSDLDPGNLTIPEWPATLELPRIQLVRAAPPHHLRAIDPTGRPWVSELVQIEWHLDPPSPSHNGSFQLRTGPDGWFDLAGIPPKASISISLQGDWRSLTIPTPAPKPPQNRVVLQPIPKPRIALQGRVVDEVGEPVADAVLRVHHGEIRRGEDFVESRTRNGFWVNHEYREVIRTGTDGTYRTPQVFPKELRVYSVEGAADGQLSNETPDTRTGEGDVLILPDLVLRSASEIREIRGRVIDLDGRPIANTHVFRSVPGPRMEGVWTDETGQFRLGGVVNEVDLVFAAADGYRFGGAIARPGGHPVTITLADVDGPPIDIPTLLPPPLPRDRELQIALELLAPFDEKARAGRYGWTGQNVPPIHSRLDPEWAVDRIAARVIPDSSVALVQAALGEFEDDPDRAIAIVEADRNPSTRASALIALADFAAESGSARTLDLLKAAESAAKLADPFDTTVNLLGELADRRLALGDLDRARTLLGDGLSIVNSWTMNRASYDIQHFAEVLAAIDLPEARAISAAYPRNRSTINHQLGEFAIRIAPWDPTLSESLILQMTPAPKFHELRTPIVETARAMAPIDLKRARGLLELLDDPLAKPIDRKPEVLPYALGLLALDLADSKPDEARAVLEESYARLNELAGDGESWQKPARAMARLLPVVERIEPDRLRERIWLTAAARVVSSEPTGSTNDDFEIATILGQIEIAAEVARYDREIAEALYIPAVRLLPRALAQGDLRSQGYCAMAIEAVAVYDTMRFADLVSGFPTLTAPKLDESLTFGTVGWSSLQASPRESGTLEGIRLLGLPLWKRRRTADEAALLDRPIHAYRHFRPEEARP